MGKLQQQTERPFYNDDAAFSTRRLFPMLAHALERSESLAMAMESRGFESRQPRAVAFRVPLRAVDFLFLIGLNGALAAGLFFL